ncbi:MAG: hypothetical protein IJ679_03320 [Lachnospiraceae bacterium]|nr:hypothetical protein [Lachnospiraceae bacterium]
MPTYLIVLIVMLVILAAMTVGLYFFGKRLEKQQAEQQQQIEANSTQVSLLIIDKKRMRLRDSGLPAAVVEAAPWYSKRAKVPVVKVKAGPRIMNLICNEEIFDEIPVKREVRATVSGLYLTKVRGLRGRLNKEPVKKGWRARLSAKLHSMRNQEG